MSEPSDAELAALLRAAKTAHEAFVAADVRYKACEDFTAEEDDRYNNALDTRAAAIWKLQRYVLGDRYSPVSWSEVSR